MKPQVLLAFTLTLLAVPAFASSEPFAPGQTWTYAARPDQFASRVRVLRVEDYPKIGRVVHVSIVELVLRRKPDSAPEAWNIGHAPFAEAALRKSVIQLEPSSATPVEGVDEAYRQWKKEADRGNIQRWTSSVTGAVTQIERWIREGRG